MTRSAIKTTLLSLVAALAVAGGALAVTAGHNPATKKLEAAFKIAQFERSQDIAKGCYPAPSAMAKILSKKGQKALAVAGTGAVRTSIVYVLKRGARCDHIEFATRIGGKLWHLDSTQGTVEVKGSGGGNANPLDAKGDKGPLRNLKLVQKSLTLTRTDEAQRGTVLCGKGSFPLGGGMTAEPALGPDGEGIYPHSYERLGAQRGWHVNPVLVDPEVLAKPGTNVIAPRRVTLQVLCGKGLTPSAAPRKSIFLKPGDQGTVTARCPKGQVLMSGGFQRTNFRTPGGSYATESHAAGPSAWRVSGRAFGNAGGELTAIAYCNKSKRPLLEEVTASSGALALGQQASATTPGCPSGRRLTAGGFSFNGSNDAWFSTGFFNSEGTWSVTGYGYFGPAPAITAFGYCAQPGR